MDTFAFLTFALGGGAAVGLGILGVVVLFLLWAILLTVIDIFEIRFRYSEEKSVQEAARRGLEYLRRQKREDFPGEDAPGNLIGKGKE